jgi:hypothetical protein
VAAEEGLKTFSPGTPIRAEDVNANFGALAAKLEALEARLQHLTAGLDEGELGTLRYYPPTEIIFRRSPANIPANHTTRLEFACPDSNQQVINGGWFNANFHDFDSLNRTRITSNGPRSSTTWQTVVRNQGSQAVEGFFYIFCVPTGNGASS